MKQYCLQHFITGLLLVTACAPPFTRAEPSGSDTLLTLTPTQEPAALPPAVATPGSISLPPAGKLYHGVYPGGVTGEESDLTLADLRSYEEAAGKNAVWVYFSHNWYEGRGFPLETATWIREAGSIPYVRLMLRSSAEQNVEEPLYNLQAIIEGQFDAGLRNWCESARDFATPLLAEYGTEVNGEWFPWNGVWNGAGQTDGYGDPAEPDGPERFRDAYRHIIQTCRDAGTDNITWVFHLNAGDYPEEDWNAFENYYPGDEWIDWVGVSNYGAQTPQDDYWEEFRAGVDAVYPRLDALTTDKPIFIAEFGVTKNNPLGDQAEWARAALADITSFRWPRLIGFSWWNERWQNDDDPTHDTTMRLQDNPALAAVFQELVGSNPNVLGASSPSSAIYLPLVVTQMPATLRAGPPPPFIANLEARQPPSLSEPSARVPFCDPVFGACLARVADRHADLSEGDASAGLKNEYSRVQSFDAGESYILARRIAAMWYLYNAALQLRGQLPLILK